MKRRKTSAEVACHAYHCYLLTVLLWSAVT